MRHPKRLPTWKRWWVPAPVDVAVVGGGLVGALAALSAARAGRSVRLLDARTPVTRNGSFGYDVRTVALSPTSLDLLGSLGVAASGTPFRRMQVWEERGTARLEFDAEAVGQPALGSIVPVGPTVAALWAALDAHPNAECDGAFPLSGIELGDDDIQLISKEDQLQTRMLVAADGIDSTVRRLLEVDAERRPTGHHALATLVRTSRPHQNVAYQCFGDEGPLALLPGPEPDLVSIVWSQPAAAAERRTSLGDVEFCAELTRVTEGVLGDILQTDVRVVLPLEQLVVDDFCPRPGVVVIGDAARVLHPLAGLGVNLGFEDVAGLGGLFTSASLGSSAEWRTYARRRRLRAQAMVALMSAFQMAYAIRDPLVRMLRNTVVGALDRSPALKAQLVREALGIGPLARAARGV